MGYSIYSENITFCFLKSTQVEPVKFDCQIILLRIKNRITIKVIKLRNASRKKQRKSPRPRIGRVSPATKIKHFLKSISAGCTYSFSLQETYTFQLHFVLHWRAQSDCSRSVWRLARPTQLLLLCLNLLVFAWKLLGFALSDRQLLRLPRME